MKKIHNFDTCLKYIFKLGIVPKTNIVSMQDWACKACDKLKEIAGNTSWYWNTFKVFHVKFNRKEQRFQVLTWDGDYKFVYLSDIK